MKKHKAKVEVAHTTVYTPITKRQATGGKIVKLHGYWKGIAEGIIDKADRRHYLNMMIDAIRTQADYSRNSNKKVIVNDDD